MERYSRFLSLNDINKDDLLSLSQKRVLIVGVGGVGQHVATYLLTNGVINLTIVDFDKVELSNLNRQFLVTEDDVGKDKVDVVKTALLKRNSEGKITSLNLKVTDDNADELVNGYDLLIDAVDNWESKLVLAKVTNKSHIPFLHVGVAGYKGQCCLFKNKSLLDVVDDEILNAPKDGVLGPMVGLVASYASLLAIRFLLNKKIETDVIHYLDFNDNRLVNIEIK